MLKNVTEMLVGFELAQPVYGLGIATIKMTAALPAAVVILSFQSEFSL